MAVEHYSVSVEKITAPVNDRLADSHLRGLRIEIPDRLIRHRLHAGLGPAQEVVVVRSVVGLNHAPLNEEDRVDRKSTNQKCGNSQEYALNEFTVHC